MSKTVVGVAPVSGEYQGHKYNKLRLYCTEPFVRSGCHGLCAEYVSLSLVDCKDILQVVSGDLSALIGLNIDVYYNRYGKAEKVVIL